MNDNQQTKPVSAKKLAANRNNPKRSRGPTSEAGKQRSSQNAFKHGFYSDRVFPSQELKARDSEGFERMLAAYRNQYAPIGDLENYCVEQIAVYSLRLARIVGHEHFVYAGRVQFNVTAMDRIVRYETTVSRLCDKTIDRLERLQAARLAKSSQLDSSNLEEDDAISSNDSTEGLTEASQEPELEEPQDGCASYGEPPATSAKAAPPVESGSEQESAPVDVEQPNKATVSAFGGEPASESTLVKAMEEAAGLFTAESERSSTMPSDA